MSSSLSGSSYQRKPRCSMARPTRAAHRLAHLDVLVRVLRRVDLVGFPAVGPELCGLFRIGLRAVEDLARRVGADLRAPAAEKLVEGHSRRLGADIPQR